MNLRSLYHRLRGRRELVQFYTNVTFSTPTRCLKLHGNIYTSPREVETGKLDCDHHFLEFPVGELADYREKGHKMEELAEKELQRREVFSSGIKKLEEGSPEEAAEYFQRAVEIDLFVPELEELADQFGDGLDKESRQKLGKIFVKAYKEKFAKPRYERQPDRMRLEREEAGVRRIKELFLDS